MQAATPTTINSPSRPTSRAGVQNPSPRTQNIKQKVNAALWEACNAGLVQDVDTISKLYDPDVNNTNQKGQSCLWIACFEGHLEVVKYLTSLTEIRPVTESLFRLVDAQVPSCDVDKTCTECGKSPLYAACEMNQAEVVSYLLEQSDASVNQPTKAEESPLHIACFHGHEDVVKLLLNNKVEVNYHGAKKKQTALNIASYFGHANVVAMLLQHADIDVVLKDCYGFDPMESAVDNGKNEVVNILKRYHEENPTEEDLAQRRKEEQAATEIAAAKAKEQTEKQQREDVARRRETEAIARRKVEAQKKLKQQAHMDARKEGFKKRQSNARAAPKIQFDEKADEDKNNLSAAKEEEEKKQEKQEKQTRRKEQEVDDNKEETTQTKIFGKTASVQPKEKVQEIKKTSEGPTKQRKKSQIIQEEFGDVFGPFSKKILNAYRKLFAEFDADNSGNIDGNELGMLLEAAGKKVSVLEIGKLIEEVDAVENGGNGDGVVSEFEFLRMLKNNRGPNVFADVTRKRAGDAKARREQLEAEKLTKTNEKLEADKEKKRRKTRKLDDEAERLRVANEQKMKQKAEWEERERQKNIAMKEELDKEWSKPRFAVGGVTIYDNENSPAVAGNSVTDNLTTEAQKEFGDAFSAKGMTAYRKLFAEFDADNSGNIDGNELGMLLEAAGKKVSVLEIGKLIEEVDAVENGGNGDGVVSEFEFLRMLKNNRGPNVFADVTRKRAGDAKARREQLEAEKLTKTNEKLEADKEKKRRKTRKLDDEAERLRVANEQKMKQKAEWEERERQKNIAMKEELDKEWSKPRFAVGGVTIYDNEEVGGIV